MQKPLISIVVPVYNAESFIESCLTSIQKQTYKNLEVIIVDDGSTDGSNAICRKITASDKRFSLYVQPNGGRSAARNKGLSLINGELVGFVDSDDWIDEDMFETLYAASVQWNAEIVQCSYFYHCGDKVQDMSLAADLVLHREEALELLFADKAIKNFLCNKLFYRTLFLDITFPMKKNFEDVSVMYQLFAKAQTVVCLAVSKYHYIVSPTSVSHAKFCVSDKFDYLDALNSQYLFAKSAGLWPKASVLLTRKYLSILDDCLVHHADSSYILLLTDYLKRYVDGKVLLKHAPYLAFRRFLFLNVKGLYVLITRSF